MTTIQQTAWYTIVIANIYSTADKTWPFIAFLVVSAFCMVAAYFERQR